MLLQENEAAECRSARQQNAWLHKPSDLPEPHARAFDLNKCMITSTLMNELQSGAG
jgi:hypothetical protein